MYIQEHLAPYSRLYPPPGSHLQPEPQQQFPALRTVNAALAFPWLERHGTAAGRGRGTKLFSKRWCEHRSCQELFSLKTDRKKKIQLTDIHEYLNRTNAQSIA